MRRLTHLVILAAIMACLVPVSMAQEPGSDEMRPPPALSLSDVLDLARSGNWAAEAARLRAQAAGTRRAQVTSLPDPMVGAMIRSADPARRTMIEANQDFPFPGKLELLGRAADAGARAARFEVDIEEARIVLEASLAFFEIGSVDAQLNLIEAYQADLVGFERSAVVQYEQGFGPQQAILKAQLEKNMLLRRIARLRAMRTDGVATLVALSGDPASGPRFAESFQLPPPPEFVPPEIGEGAADRRPEMRQLQAYRDQSTEELAFARRSFLPDFRVSASFSRMEGIGIGGGVKIPLWKAPRRAAVEEAQVRERAVDASMEDLRVHIQADVEGASARLGAEIETLALLRNTLIPQAKAALDATTSAYTNGRTDFLDLLDSQRMLFTLRLDLIDAVTSALQGAASLEFAARFPVLPASESH